MMKITGLLWWIGAGAFVGCAGQGPYRLTQNFEALGAPAPKCRHSGTIIVPELPASDRLLGDIVVRCQRNCTRDYAIAGLLHLAEEHNASRVSSLSCVQEDEGWVCVGHASSTPLCEEES